MDAGGFRFSTIPSAIAELDVLIRVNPREELPAIQSKLAELGEEMIAHQGKEEVVLFPYISKFERYASSGGAKPRSCFGTIDHPITMMTRDHDYAALPKPTKQKI